MARVMTGLFRDPGREGSDVLIYFDNAATTMMKPASVCEAVTSALTSFGGVARGAHEASRTADRAVFQARRQIADLLGGPGPGQVAFCANATAALNTVIDGLLHEGDHAITTAASHNSVLRPLYRKREAEGVELSILPVARDASISCESFEALFCDNTRLAVVTHASNLTGDVYDIARMATIAHDHGALLIVDAAQTAGLIPLDMRSQGIDVVAFSGHKSLYGPQGTGGLCVAEEVDIPALLVGGSGIDSYNTSHPSAMPEHLEAGTLNAHGIAGLSAGIDYIEEMGLDALATETRQLTERFESGVADIPGVRLFGGHGGIDRTGVVALNIGTVDSAVVADLLDREYGICTRAGAHCAPLMHEALGTREQGIVRFSFSSFNTRDEIDRGIAAVTELAESLG